MKEIPEDKFVPDDKYNKLTWQMERQMDAFLSGCITMYGYQHDVPMLAHGCRVIAEIWGEAIRGREIPITEDTVKHRRRKKKKK